MRTSDRRRAIWYTLCRQRFAQIEYLAQKYHVSARTIRYDVEALSRVYPIETRTGKNGGVKVADWYQPGKTPLQPEQFDFLLNICQHLNDDDAARMCDIIETLSEDHAQ